MAAVEAVGDPVLLVAEEYPAQAELFLLEGEPVAESAVVVEVDNAVVPAADTAMVHSQPAANFAGVEVVAPQRSQHYNSGSISPH